ncbi:MAG TPA: type II secretion system protein [Burkholderiaceae bacterium]|nr:type II secretion system protein [Burkholderiaceae bacterium]
MSCSASPFALRTRGWRRSRTVRGFGLLEAIVAVVLLASVGGALFSWLSQSVNAASRLEAASLEARLSSQAEQAFAQVNVFKEPSGERRWGQLQLRWKSTLISPMRYAVMGDVDAVRWRVGLYQVQLQVRDLDSGHDLTLDLTRTGLEDLYATPRAADTGPAE